MGVMQDGNATPMWTPWLQKRMRGEAVMTLCNDDA